MEIEKLSTPEFMKKYNVTKHQISMALHRSKILDYEPAVLNGAIGYGGVRRMNYIIMNEKVDIFLAQIKRHEKQKNLKMRTCHNGIEVRNDLLGSVCLGVNS